jgi:peroxiredoxin
MHRGIPRGIGRGAFPISGRDLHSVRAIRMRPDEPAHLSPILSPGATAPNFALGSSPGQTVRLSDFRGAPVVLVFYPADWSPVCGDQVTLYNECMEEFDELGAKVLGVSVDSCWCHEAYAKAKKLRFPLLADFEPKGAVSRLYGVYRASDGTSERALFVVDADGIIRWSHLSPIEVNPGADGILRALEALGENTK